MTAVLRENDWRILGGKDFQSEKWGLSVVPMGGFQVAVEVHLVIGSHLSEHVEYQLLLLGRQDGEPFSALVVRVATELGNQELGELVVLVGKHVLLDLGEPLGISYGLGVSIVRALRVFRASLGIDKAQGVTLR